MMLDMMVKTKKTPSELLRMLEEKLGPHHYERWDVTFDPNQRDSIQARFRGASPSSLAGRRVESIDTRDGVRFALQGGYWGAGPILRHRAPAPHLCRG